MPDLIVKKELRMSPTSPADALNDLLILHGRSLAMYLADAAPWSRASDAPALSVLRNISADHQRMVDRMGNALSSIFHRVDLGEFPIDFADRHDLAISFLLPELIEEEKRLIQRIQEASGRLNGWPLGKSLADEALGSARAHLESLTEVASSN